MRFFLCDCGVLFQRPLCNPNLENSISGFEEAYLQYLSEGPEDRLNFVQLQAYLCNFLPNPDRLPILDLGCGSGKFVRFLREQNLEVLGVEPSEALYERYLSKEPTIFYPSIEALVASERGPFGAIVANDVLEHVADPRQFISDISTLLCKGGILLLSTPDLASPVARLLGKRWHHVNRYHLALFTRPAMIRLAAEAGLTALNSRYLCRLFSLGYAIKYLCSYAFHMTPPAFLRRLDTIAIPINLRDTITMVFRKAG